MLHSVTYYCLTLLSPTSPSPLQPIVMPYFFTEYHKSRLRIIFYSLINLHLYTEVPFCRGICQSQLYINGYVPSRVHMPALTAGCPLSQRCACSAGCGPCACHRVLPGGSCTHGRERHQWGGGGGGGVHAQKHSLHCPGDKLFLPVTSRNSHQHSPGLQPLTDNYMVLATH